MRITKEQYKELNQARFNQEEFNEKLEEILGLEIIPITTYQYYDGESFIGDSYGDYDLKDILKEMFVVVEE